MFETKIGHPGRRSEEVGSSKAESPGHSGYLPSWGFGSPGDLGSPQYRLTALPCIARPDLKNEFFPDFFSISNLIANQMFGRFLKEVYKFKEGLSFVL